MCRWTRLFFKAHPEIENEARVVTVTGENGTWHLVVIGDYASRNATRQDVPASIDVDNVYARCFVAVRD